MNAASCVGERGVGDLEHVLGVQLARVREVEAADEDDVVGDRDLRVHVVVDGARRVRRRVLAGEGRARERRPQERLLPRRVAVRRATGGAPRASASRRRRRRRRPSRRSTHLGERREDRRRREHRRGDPDARASRCRSPSRSDARAARRGPGRTTAAPCVAATVSGDVSTLPLCSTSRRVQSCSKSARVACRELGRVDGDDDVLLARPRVARSSSSSRSTPTRRRGPRTCGA